GRRRADNGRRSAASGPESPLLRESSAAHHLAAGPPGLADSNGFSWSFAASSQAPASQASAGRAESRQLLLSAVSLSMNARYTGTAAGAAAAWRRANSACQVLRRPARTDGSPGPAVSGGLEPDSTRAASSR